MTVSGGVVDALRFQRDVSTSPLYQALIDATLDDIDAGGPCSDVLTHVDPTLHPIADAVPLRFLAGVHALVLSGTASDLAVHYPSAGGRADATDGLGEVFIATVDAHRDALVAALQRPVQTNEVGRSAVLLLGYLELARATGLPLRIVEVGSSAGLNLRWDRYRYEGGLDASAWGDAASAVRFTDCYADPLPDLAVSAVVAERNGCDANPIDATTPESQLLLRSFVWADQRDRLAALDAALGIAESMPVTIERRDAGDFVDEQLARPMAGVATVVSHSIVWQYLSPETRRRIVERLRTSGAAATGDAPLAWLRMEPGPRAEKSAELRLTQWPGGEERLLARAGFHGTPVRMVR